jgi:hypothetical protein
MGAVDSSGQEVLMEDLKEGAVIPPVPYVRRRVREAIRPGVLLPRDAGELRCEMCGAPVIASHCKRICLKCGFMTGCSEGIA